MQTNRANAVAVQEPQTPQAMTPVMTVAGLVEQSRLIKQALNEVMVIDYDYGSPPGCQGLMLYKAGAEKLGMLFRLSPTFEEETLDLGNGHREYKVECTLTHRPTGTIAASCIASCSTMEKKYRYRWQGQGSGRRRVENPDIEDQWNTVLKMAEKRAFVGAILMATGASAIFVPDDGAGDDEPAEPQQQKAPEPPAEQAGEKHTGGSRGEMVNRCADLHKALGSDLARTNELLEAGGCQTIEKGFSELNFAHLRQAIGILGKEVALRGGAL